MIKGSTGRSILAEVKMLQQFIRRQFRFLCGSVVDLQGDTDVFPRGEEGEQIGDEGCLSIPGQSGLVKRPLRVKVKAQDRNGKTFEVSGEGLLARAFCHEIDHLNGILYKDKVIRG